MTSNPSRYRLETTDGVTILALGPDLNDASWTEIEQVGKELLERVDSIRSPSVLVDLSALNFMGSAMVALLVRIWKWVQEREGQMVIVNRHQMIAEILNISGLRQIWTIVETPEQGLAELGVGRRSAGGGVLVLLQILALVGALAGLGLLFDSVPQIVQVPPRTALLVGCGFAMLGLIVGTVGALKHRGGRRGFSVVVVTASVLVVLTGVLSVPPIRGVVPDPLRNVFPKENPPENPGEHNNGAPDDVRDEARNKGQHRGIREVQA